MNSIWGQYLKHLSEAETKLNTSKLFNLYSIKLQVISGSLSHRASLDRPYQKQWIDFLTQAWSSVFTWVAKLQMVCVCEDYM